MYNFKTILKREVTHKHNTLSVAAGDGGGGGGGGGRVHGTLLSVWLTCNEATYLR